MADVDEDSELLAEEGQLGLDFAAAADLQGGVLGGGLERISYILLGKN